MKLPVTFGFLFLLLSACTQLGLAPADSFDAKLAYAYGSHTSVMQAAATAVKAKDISKEDGQQVLKLADESRALLDTAKGLSGTDPATASGKLILATAILTNLQQYLRTHQ